MAGDRIVLPITIPEGSVILSTSPLTWREPDGTESTLTRVYWAADGWHVDITSVSVATGFSISIGTDKDRE